MHPGWWDTFIGTLRTIPIPGEGLSWNCQDYVIDIWDAMLAGEMINEETWAEGKERMLPYYGQEFSGQETEDGSSEEEEEGRQGQAPLSEEFVLDSSE